MYASLYGCSGKNEPICLIDDCRAVDEARAYFANQLTGFQVKNGEAPEV